MTSPADPALLALAERLERAWRGTPERPGSWLDVAAEARAAEGEETGRLREVEKAARRVAVDLIETLGPSLPTTPEPWTDEAGHQWPWKIGGVSVRGKPYVCGRCGAGWGSALTVCPGEVPR